MKENRIALVTGANRGIGKQIAKELAIGGLIVIVTARDSEKGKKIVTEFNLAGLDVQFHLLDVTSASSMNAVTNHLQKEFGKLDILINNAGIMGANADTMRTSIDDFRKTMETNFFGPLQLSRLLVPLLKKSNSGRIINISSGLGAMHSMGGGYSDYRVSKTALNSLTAIMGSELSNTSIKVNTVDPGWVRTDMGGAGATRSVEKGAETAVWLALTENIPTGKFFRDKKIIDW
jgi:NAD(P)-dependent dehydrogenase (short-subunit alcohol dehydrogenase family)